MKPLYDDGGEGCHQYEFYFPEVDVHVRVENNDDEVLCRASSPNFSDRRKFVFIRHLATEGFIPIQYCWFADCSSGFSGVRWIVDTSWLIIHPAVTRRTSKFMRCLLVEAGLLWLTVLTIIIMRAS